MSLQNIGFSDINPINGNDFSVQLLLTAAPGLVICAGTKAEEPLRLLRLIRSYASKHNASIPVMCVIDRVTPLQLEEILNAGANCVTTLPISCGTLLRNVHRALSDTRNFASPDDRQGPSRHTADASASPEKAKAAAPAPRAKAPTAARSHAEGTPGGKGSPSERTLTLLDGLRQVVATIEGIRAALAASHDGPTRKALRMELVDAVQRLVNLMALADTKIEPSKDVELNLKNALDSVRRVFFDVIEQIVQSRLDGINNDITAILSRNEVCLGCSDSLAKKLLTVEEALSTMEGAKRFSNNMKYSLASAWESISKIEETELSVFRIHDFSGPDNKSYVRNYTLRASAALRNISAGSQHEVSRLVSENNTGSSFGDISLISDSGKQTHNTHG